MGDIRNECMFMGRKLASRRARRIAFLKGKYEAIVEPICKTDRTEGVDIRRLWSLDDIQKIWDSVGLWFVEAGR